VLPHLALVAAEEAASELEPVLVQLASAVVDTFAKLPLVGLGCLLVVLVAAVVAVAIAETAPVLARSAFGTVLPALHSVAQQQQQPSDSLIVVVEPQPQQQPAVRGTVAVAEESNLPTVAE
jgi:hypothetical protein